MSIVMLVGITPIFDDQIYKEMRLDPDWGLPKVLSLFSSTLEALESWESVCHLYERHRAVFQLLEGKIHSWEPNKEETRKVKEIWSRVFGYLNDREKVDSQRALFADLFILESMSHNHGRRELSEYHLSQRTEEQKREDFAAASAELTNRMNKKFSDF